MPTCGWHGRMTTAKGGERGCRCPRQTRTPRRAHLRKLTCESLCFFLCILHFDSLAQIVLQYATIVSNFYFRKRQLCSLRPTTTSFSSTSPLSMLSCPSMLNPFFSIIELPTRASRTWDRRRSETERILRVRVIGKSHLA